MDVRAEKSRLMKRIRDEDGRLLDFPTCAMSTVCLRKQSSVKFGTDSTSDVGGQVGMSGAGSASSSLATLWTGWA